MSKLIKKYWKWDERLNKTNFKLGMSITPSLEKDLVIQNPNNPNEYIGKIETPWKIETKDGIIQSVFYRELFFPITEDKNIWDKEISDFESQINNLLEEIDEEYTGDILYVVFRDFFVAVAGIIRK